MTARPQSAGLLYGARFSRALPRRRLLPGMLLSGVLISGLAGCGSPPPPPPPPTLDLTITGSADLNPDANGSPQPVDIHLYQLAATGKFAKADVFALIEKEQATLGTDDLGSSDLILKPGDKQEVKQDLKPGTQALGVVAYFRDIDNATWRASAPVAPNGPTKLVLTVSKLSIVLKPAAK